jgi:hypothetical protein
VKGPPDPLGRRSAPSREAGGAGASGTWGAGVAEGGAAGKDEAVASEEEEWHRHRAWDRQWPSTAGARGGRRPAQGQWRTEV